MHGSDFSGNNNKDFVRTNRNLVKCFSNSSSNLKAKTNSLSLDKGINEFENKEQNNDLVANIKKVLKSKKNDNINGNQIKNVNIILNKETNNDLNNKLKKNTKKIKNI